MHECQKVIQIEQRKHNLKKSKEQKSKLGQFFFARLFLFIVKFFTVCVIFFVPLNKRSPKVLKILFNLKKKYLKKEKNIF